MPRSQGLRDAAAASSVAASASNETDTNAQRHTDTEDTDIADHTDCHRQGIASSSTYIQNSQHKHCLVETEGH